MAQRKAAMDFGALRRLGDEVSLQFFKGIDFTGIRGAVRLGPREEVVLDGL